MMRGLLGRVAGALAVVLILALTSGPSRAAGTGDVAAFYKGNQIRIIVGFGPGGGYDTYARLVARHMSQYIPGNPAVIVENRPGAGSIVAANTVYNTEPKDGTVVVTMNPIVVLFKLLGQDVQFDAEKFRWLGAGSVEYLACVVRKDSGVTTFAQAQQKSVPMAAEGVGALSYAVEALLNSAVGTKFKIVPGYTSIPDQFLAVQKNEVGGACQAYISTLLRTQRQFLEGPDPLLKPIVFVGAQLPPESFMRGVPTLDSVTKTPDAKAIFRVIQLMGVLSYPYAVAPGVPPERIAALATAFKKTTADPDFLKDASQAGMLIAPHDAAQVTQYVNQLIHTSPDVMAQLKPVLARQ